MENQILGKKFKSNSGGCYTVIKKLNEKRDRNFLYEIIFDECNGKKFKTSATKGSIIRGTVKNPFYPKVYGIGYLGSENKIDNGVNQRHIYVRWHSMLNRCYNTKNHSYKYYGGKGVVVDERWHSFKNFYHDFLLLEGYDEKNLHNLQLDKDMKVFNNKIYSSENCMLITRFENNVEKNERYNKCFTAYSPLGEIFKSNNQRQFARENNLTSTGINGVLKNKQPFHKGWKFEYVD